MKLNTVVVTVFFSGIFRVANAFSQPKVSDLLGKHKETIDELKKSCDLDDDLTLLRYCVEYEDDVALISEKIAKNLQWRENNKAICEAAKKAVEEAQAGEKWDNGPVRDAAPYSSVINQYITPSQVLTTTSNKGDFLYCIRAAKINDKELMSKGEFGFI